MGPVRPVFVGLAVVVSFVVIFFAYVDDRYTMGLRAGVAALLPARAANGISGLLQSDPILGPAYVVDTPGCRIPQWNPFDPTVKKFYKPPAVPYKCGSAKTAFVSIDENNTLYVDPKVYVSSSIGNKGNSRKALVCRYQPIFRDSGTDKKPSDDKFKLGKPTILESISTKIEHEFIVVRCHSGGRLISEDFLFTIPPKSGQPDVTRRPNSCEVQGDVTTSIPTSPTTPKSSSKLNILLVGIDSISKLNFVRHFPRTLKFLRNHLKAIELDGYTKVADNTFPNLVPLLTGQFIDYYWNESVKYRFFDELDFIWKVYACQGYRTLFAEDDPGIATFNYLKKGFRQAPTDYYFRPFALAMERSFMRSKSKRDCFKNKMEIEVVFDYAKKFAHTMAANKKPFFGFAFVARLTHDLLNAAAYADIPSVSLLKQLHTNGILNNTLMVFFSDHGIRFGDIRKTYIGKFEERMPFLFLVFPDWFTKKYPNATHNLRTNQRRLTTPFDIHATLLHLLDFTSSDLDDVSMGNVSERGISLLHEIPEQRTCADAAIFTHWCPCQIHKPVSTSDAKVISGSHVLIQTINDWLTPYSNSCAQLKLVNILSARAGEPNDDVLRFVRNVNDVINRHVQYGQRVSSPVDYLLTVEVSPSGAVFEGTLRYDQTDKTFRVLGDVSRINRYGNQSECITDANIRKFCYCKDLGA